MTSPRDVIADTVRGQVRRYTPHGMADTIIQALKEAGFVVVPAEPTFEMWSAAETESLVADGHEPEHGDFPTARVAHLVIGYRAMVKAYEHG